MSLAEASRSYTPRIYSILRTRGSDSHIVPRGLEFVTLVTRERAAERSRTASTHHPPVIYPPKEEEERSASCSPQISSSHCTICRRFASRSLFRRVSLETNEPNNIYNVCTNSRKSSLLSNACSSAAVSRCRVPSALFLLLMLPACCVMRSLFAVAAANKGGNRNAFLSFRSRVTEQSAVKARCGDLLEWRGAKLAVCGCAFVVVVVTHALFFLL